MGKGIIAVVLSLYSPHKKVSGMTDENHPSGSGKNGENSNQKFNWINIVDILVKLIAALVAIAVTVIAGP